MKHRGTESTEEYKGEKGQKRRDPETQRGVFEYSPASACPCGAHRSVCECLGTQAFLSIASLSAATFGGFRRTRSMVLPFAEAHFDVPSSPAVREAYRGREVRPT